MHIGSGGRFEAVAANSGVNQQVDIFRLRSRSEHRLFPSHGGGLRRERRAAPKTAFPNPRHQLKASLREFQAGINGREFFFEQLGAPNFVGKFDRHTFNDCSGKFHAPILPQNPARGDKKRLFSFASAAFYKKNARPYEIDGFGRKQHR